MSTDGRAGWTRRRLLRGLLRWTAAAVASSAAWVKLACTREPKNEPLEPAIASIVSEVSAALPGHRIERDALVAFARDLAKHRAEDGLRPVAELDPPRRFLLSSDLFLRDTGDAARPLRYVSFYDPYLGPCRNPLPRRIIAGDEEDSR